MTTEEAVARLKILAEERGDEDDYHALEHLLSLIDDLMMELEEADEYSQC